MLSEYVGMHYSFILMNFISDSTILTGRAKAMPKRQKKITAVLMVETFPVKYLVRNIW